MALVLVFVYHVVDGIRNVMVLGYISGKMQWDWVEKVYEMGGINGLVGAAALIGVH